MRNFGDIIDDGGAAEQGWFRRQTPVGLLVKFFAVCVLIGLFSAGCGLITGYWGEAKRQVSVGNVKGNWQFAYDYNNSLKTIARQWCDIKAATSGETDANVKSQRETQMLAISQNYQRVEADYDAHLQDAFRLKYIKPSNVPTTAPTLTEEASQVC